MNHWAFVIGAYAVALSSVAALVLWAWMTMRRAENRVEELRRK